MQSFDELVLLTSAPSEKSILSFYSPYFLIKKKKNRKKRTKNKNKKYKKKTQTNKKQKQKKLKEKKEKRISDICGKSNGIR